ncbi:hypothetical protein F5I97DRAFT_713588 [Phlebopus sp. FC_14]|nr:hypothetical protein F5I97DRAFT_713588 [Phlebopus sp. FC_14]
MHVCKLSHLLLSIIFHPGPRTTSGLSVHRPPSASLSRAMSDVLPIHPVARGPLLRLLTQPISSQCVAPVFTQRVATTVSHTADHIRHVYRHMVVQYQGGYSCASATDSSEAPRVEHIYFIRNQSKKNHLPCLCLRLRDHAAILSSPLTSLRNPFLVR